MGMETHGQYVFYYNERLKGKTYPGDYSTYAYNDICELKVMGKCFHSIPLVITCALISLYDFFDLLFSPSIPF